ncbi:MAG: OmpA family protein [Granulosicoccus sp.]
MKQSAKSVFQILCCISALALSSCVSTEELYAEYDANNCKFIIEKQSDNTQIIREVYSDTLHTWQPVVFFDYKEDTLTPDTKERLKRALLVLDEVKSSKLALQGFTDYMGSVDYNLDLASRRVNAVKDWLVRNGINANRISLRTMGEGLESFVDDIDQSRAYNRRVELMLLDDKGLPMSQLRNPKND